MSTGFNTRAAAALPLMLVLWLAGAAQVALSCPCAELSVPADPEKGIGLKEGLDFLRSRQYRRDFDAAIRSARRACLAHMGQPAVAVVADIDETLLDNQEGLRQMLQSAGGRTVAGKDDVDWSQFRAWVARGDAPVLKPTAEFLSWARRHGFAVFLVTGRRESLRKPTIENLVLRNIAYDGLYMRAESDERPAEQVKAPHRKAIEDLGFKVIVNIGDQYSDLTGGYAEDCEKLPNRFYFVE